MHRKQAGAKDQTTTGSRAAGGDGAAAQGEPGIETCTAEAGRASLRDNQTGDGPGLLPHTRSTQGEGRVRTDGARVQSEASTRRAGPPAAAGRTRSVGAPADSGSRVRRPVLSLLVASPQPPGEFSHTLDWERGNCNGN